MALTVLPTTVRPAAVPAVADDLLLVAQDARVLALARAAVLGHVHVALLNVLAQVHTRVRLGHARHIGCAKPRPASAARAAASTVAGGPSLRESLLTTFSFFLRE